MDGQLQRVRVVVVDGQAEREGVGVGVVGSANAAAAAPPGRHALARRRARGGAREAHDDEGRELAGRSRHAGCGGGCGGLLVVSLVVVIMPLNVSMCVRMCVRMRMNLCVGHAEPTGRSGRQPGVAYADRQDRACAGVGVRSPRVQSRRR